MCLCSTYCVFMFYVMCSTYCVCMFLCSLYAPMHQNKFQVGVNLLGNKYYSDSDSDVCIYIMYTYQMQDMYNTCCFPSPSATQPSSLPPFLSPPGRPQADGFPLMCRGSA